MPALAVPDAPPDLRTTKFFSNLNSIRLDNFRYSIAPRFVIRNNETIYIEGREKKRNDIRSIHHRSTNRVGDPEKWSAIRNSTE